jgi:cellulose synthase/poly-beta-1,6-N-acetylglucosamine synthase-like glycosyltransferase
MSVAPSVSIVITAHNEAETIVGTLRSVAAQRDVGTMEILLVDDRSTDGTGELAGSLDLPNLRLIRIDHFDHPTLTARQVALDTGIRAAKGELVFLTDADGLVPTDWVSTMSQRLESADAVAGRVDCVPRPDHSNLLIASLQTVDAAFYSGVCSVLNACGFPSGIIFNNCAFRREWYEKVGGFEAIGFALTEDLSFAREIHRHGARLAFQVHPAVSVRACGSAGEFIRRAHRIGSGGVSALSVALGLWMLFWLGLLLATPFSPLLFGLTFIGRHFTGVAFVAFWLIRSRRLDLLPFALVYEPAAILTGLAVMWDARTQRKVEWGGVDYPQ